MSFDAVADNDVEQTLLKYIDLPYFRNNPSYIALWQRHYARTRDPRILFLMKHKKISQYYHWLYIELSRLFLSRGNVAMSFATLDMGIASKAHDIAVLEEELAKIPVADRLYCEHEASLLLNPKGFFTLGKIWNSYGEKLFYDRKMFVVGDEEISFEEYRALRYKQALELSANGAEAARDHLSMDYDGDACKKLRLDDSREPSDLLSGSVGEEHQQVSGGDILDEAGRERMVDGSVNDGRDALDINTSEISVADREDAKTASQGDGFCCIRGSLEINSEVSIGGFIFYVRDAADGRHRLMRIAKEGSDGQTINVRDFLLQEITKTSLDAVSGMDPRFIPSFSVAVLDPRLFLLYEDHQLGSLRSCLDVPEQIPPGIILYFADQLAEIFEAMCAAGCAFAAFSLDSICITDDCRLKIVDFSWTEHNPSIDCCGIALQLLKGLDVRLLNRDGDRGMRIKRELGKVNLKQVVLRYKMRLYEKIYAL